MKLYTIKSKKQLTDDVFELVFESDYEINETPGQFITFILPNGIGGKSYSILGSSWNECTLIIKRCEDGQGGSKYICDSQVWDELKWVGPVGKFVLHSDPNAKLFAGTGTWLVPLYNQIKKTLQDGNTHKVHLLFGVRYAKDVFYEQELQELANTYLNFSFTLSLSRENTSNYSHSYITEFVTQDMKDKYDEVYLCGAPVVVDAMQEKLEWIWFEKAKIFTEKY